MSGYVRFGDESQDLHIDGYHAPPKRDTFLKDSALDVDYQIWITVTIWIMDRTLRNWVIDG